MQGATPTSGKLVPIPTAWVSSGNYLAIPYGRVLHLQKTTTLSQPVHCATTGPHDAVITSLHAISGMQFVTSSEDATLRFWDALDGNCLRTVDFAKPVLATVPIQDALICLTVSELILEPSSGTSKTRIVICDKIKTDSSSRLAASSTASVIGFTNAACLHLVFGSKKPHKMVDISFPNALCAITISPDASFLAVADITGKIFLIKDITAKVSPDFERVRLSFQKLLPTVFHWHASTVSSIVFAHKNTVLLSAGMEGVLVTWSLTPASFGERTFLPRLRAPVVALSVSPDETTYAISHQDNSVVFLEQAQGTVSTTIRALNAPTALENRTTGFVACPTYPVGALYVCTGGDQIQIFDPVRGKHIDEFSTLPRNNIFKAADVNQGNRPITFKIDSIAAHRNGCLLATLDLTEQKIAVGKQVRIVWSTTLRIWARKDPTDFWDLSAVVSNPHGDGNAVNSIEFHPELLALITTGSDGKFRIWRAVKNEKEHREKGQNPSWRCEVAREHRGLICKCTAFSNDGSLLAVGFENMVTLWDVENIKNDSETVSEVDVGLYSACSMRVSLIQTLVHAPMFDAVQKLKYCMCGVPLFVAVTERGIYLWNAVTQGIWWSFGVRCIPSSLTVDERNGRFAVIVRVAGVVSDEKNMDVPLEIDAVAGDTAENWSNDGREAVKNKSPKQRKTRQKGKSLRPRGNVEGKGQDENNKLHESSASSQFGKSGVDINGDFAVAVFDAKTSNPIRVNRLSPGVCAGVLEFVNTRGDLRDNSKLICIDSNSEVSTMNTDGDKFDEFSFVSDDGFGSRQGASVEELEHRNLDAMFGEQWKEEMYKVRANTEAVEVEYGNSDLEKLLNKHFPGPIHTQAPVIVQAPSFIWDLLQLEKDRKRSEQPTRIDGQDDATKDVVNGISNTEGPDVKADKNDDKTDSIEDRGDKMQIKHDLKDVETDFREMFRICKRIIKEVKTKERN